MKRKVNQHPFAWLDEVVEITLNPNLITAPVTLNALEQILGQLPAQTRTIECCLKSQTFGLRKKTDIQAVVELYYHEALHLHRLAAEHLRVLAENLSLAGALRAIITSLEDLTQRIRRRYQNYLPDAAAGTLPSLPARLFKLLIKMSGDQIGIVARAAYQAGLIPARSLRAALKLVIPHVSTDRYEELSPESVRSHSGQPETGDLDTVVAYLYKLIEIVKGYYRRGRRRT